MIRYVFYLHFFFFFKKQFHCSQREVKENNLGEIGVEKRKRKVLVEKVIWVFVNYEDRSNSTDCNLSCCYLHLFVSLENRVMNDLRVASAKLTKNYQHS